MPDLWVSDFHGKFSSLLQSLQEQPSEVDKGLFFQMFPRAFTSYFTRRQFKKLEELLKQVQALPIWSKSHSLAHTLDALFEPEWETKLPTIYFSLVPEEQKSFIQVFSRFPPTRIPEFLHMAAKSRDGEPFYKIVQNLTQKDPQALIDCLKSDSEILAYHAHVALKLWQDDHVLEKVSQLSRHPQTHTRRFAVSVIRTWNSKTAKRRLLEFLRDPDPQIRKTVLLSPERLASYENFSALLQLLESDEISWDEEDLIQLYSALLLSDHSQAWPWLEAIFQQKSGLLNKSIERKKELLVEVLCRGSQEEFFQWAGRLLQGDYFLSDMLRDKLVRFRERTRVRKQTSRQIRRKEMEALLSPNSSSVSKTLETEGQRTAHKDKICSKSQKEENRETFQPKVSVKRKGEDMSSPLPKPNSSKTPLTSPLSQPTEREFTPSPAGPPLGELEKVIERELATHPTQDLQEDLKELANILQKSPPQSLEEALENLEQAVQDEPSTSPPLFTLFAKELFLADNGRFLNVVKTVFCQSLPREWQTEKAQLLELLVTLEESSIDFFLDYLYHSKQDHIPPQSLPLLKEHLQKKGLL